jgi:hypothetical protein
MAGRNAEMVPQQSHRATYCRRYTGSNEAPLEVAQSTVTEAVFPVRR